MQCHRVKASSLGLSTSCYSCLVSCKESSSWCISLHSPGPISSILVNKYGSRPIMIAGGCLSGCGLIAASFCNTVEELYFCVGVVGGK